MRYMGRRYVRVYGLLVSFLYGALAGIIFAYIWLAVR